MANITVKVTGGAVRELSDVNTVGEVKERLQLPNHAAAVNGESAANDFELEDYNFVTLSPAVKGGLR